MATFTGVLLVSFDEMQSVVNSFNSTAQQVQSTTNSMMSSVTNMNRDWVGAAGSSYIKKFQQLQQDMNDFHHIILEYVSDLLEMIRNYKQAEQEIQNNVSGLATDVITY